MEKLTIEETFEHIGFGKFHYIIVLICGILQSFDAMEMLILAYLQPLLKCVWQTNLWEESFLITGVFIGMLFGSPIMGRLCDLYGRKQILMISSFSLAYMSLICAASPTIIWITVLRTVIGAFLGGIMSSLGTLVSEFMPVTNRGSALMIILAFWPLGSYIITILCVTIVPLWGWRIFLVISTLPLILSLPLLLWLPESPRFLLLKHRKKEALQIINRIADNNKAPRINDVIEPVYSRISFWDLFHANYLSTTFITFFLWFVSGLTYYGLILIVASVDIIPRQCSQYISKYSPLLNAVNSTVDESCCVPFTWYNTKDIMISTTGELLFLPLSIYLINILGRKFSIAIFTFFLSISFLLINICMPPVALSVLLFLTRGSISASFNINYIYTSEVFPTSVRSVALGLCNMSARIGAIMSPFIINFIIKQSSFFAGTMIFTLLNIFSCAAVILLPYETKNRPFFQTADESEINPIKIMEK